jgi:murein DD-endopeptidase MepM/ murein hydrolase activator NlpD
MLAVVVVACTSAPQPSAPQPSEPSAIALRDDLPQQRSAAVDPLRCTDRATIPTVEHVTTAKWSPDSSAIALTRIVTIPSHQTITGYEEDQRLSVYYLRTGRLRDFGTGNRPEWSESGAYLVYWNDDGRLHVNVDGAAAGIIEASVPAVRWKGEDLYFWHADEIRAWHDGVSRTVSRVDPELAPRYPHDDAYFSADAERFTITRYFPDGSAERYLGVTATGEMTPLDTPGLTYTEWSPKGETLLLRSNDQVGLREPDGSTNTAFLAAFPGTVHGWTPDGRLYVGGVSPTVPGGNTFDRFLVWDPKKEAQIEAATLPNLLGFRSFSPDGAWFGGVMRTGLYATQLELYRCGVAADGGTDLRADPVARARLARIDEDGRRFVRPVAGAITQFLQGSHTGIDIAAPIGSLIVAADDGIIDAAGWVRVGGRRVCVQHAVGIQSCYYHTSAALVSIGERVARGQPIALIGMSGFTTGPHVHWEVKQDGRIVDPLGL